MLMSVFQKGYGRVLDSRVDKFKGRRKAFAMLRLGMIRTKCFSN